MKAFLFALALAGVARAAPEPIYPLPQSIEMLDRAFTLDARTSILLPPAVSERDRCLARLLTAELSDRYGFAIHTESTAALAPGRRAILMGTPANPLVQAEIARRSLKLPGDEGYVLNTSGDVLLVAGADDAGAFYGLQSLRQLIRKDASGLRILGARIRDWPYKPFRAVKIYLPGSANIPFFQRFVRDFVALYKFNRIVIEMNAGMRLDRHPELNAGWIDFANDLYYRRLDHPEAPNRQGSNSSHQDTADGRVIEKEDVAGMVRFAARNFVEVIPEIPSLSHSYYLLTRHPDLSEVPGAEWPDTYCPYNPKSYDLLFDVLDEYIEVTHPRMIHMGHDEWGMDINACPRCRGKDFGDLYAQDVIRIHDYLKSRGIRMAIWGDFLLESVAGKSPRRRNNHVGVPYFVPGALRPEQAARIPRDILIFNWFWADPGQDANERQLSQWGFEQVYGNFRPGMDDYRRRSSLPGVIGGVPSAWTAATEFNLGKDTLFEFAGCAEMIWSGRDDPPGPVADRVQALMPQIRRNFSAQAPPSAAGDPIVPVAMKNAVASAPGFDLKRLKTGRTGIFDLRKAAVTADSGPVRIGQDASSLIFLHACARRAANEQGHRYIYNFEDTADLLGFYEVLYEDGLTVSVPIRYSYNILEWTWGAGPDSERFLYLAGTTGRRAADQPTPWSNSWYSYLSDPVDAAENPARPIRLFAYEWVNPRFGKVIREVRLKRSTGFTNFTGRVIPDNPVALAAISVVRKREAKRTSEP